MTEAQIGNLEIALRAGVPCRAARDKIRRMSGDRTVDTWLDALHERHLQNLTSSECARALRALSSCYVERRAKLQHGGALDSAGKRAAFALFYGPLHFLVTREIVRAIPGALDPVAAMTDLGCGTGAAGAAWASVVSTGSRSHGPKLTGIDRHPWAVSEANRTYASFDIAGRAIQGDIARVSLEPARPRAVLAAYAVNELNDDARASLLPRLLAAHTSGTRTLIIEPIARRMSGWWPEWERAVLAAGGRTDEWRFTVPIPKRQRDLARAAGLDPRELTARSLWMA